MSISLNSSVSAPNQPEKLAYVDNIKIILIILVILVHTCIAYGALFAVTGKYGWYYIEETKQIRPLIAMFEFVIINQSFFMGLFFFLSACFLTPSYEKKGPAHFTMSRLKRLGIPLLFYSLVLSPFLIYSIKYTKYVAGPVSKINPIDFGVLWFVAALLIFTLFYVLWRIILKKRKPIYLAAPSAMAIVVSAIMVGIITYFVRIYFPIENALPVVEFHLGIFPQYIFLFIVGIIAYQNNWLNTLSIKTANRLAILIVILLLPFPLYIIYKVKVYVSHHWRPNSFHWEYLIFPIWEQLLSFSIITVVLCYGKKWLNRPSVFLKKMSRCLFGVYIFHPLIIVFLTFAFSSWAVDPAIKLLVVGPLAVIGSFSLSALILTIPGVKKII